MTRFATLVAHEGAFWFEVLSDHTDFIHDALSPDSTALARRVEQARASLQRLQVEARAMLSGAALPESLETMRRGLAAATELRDLKHQILQAQLDCRLTIGLPPTFVQHTINEAEEAMRTFRHLAEDGEPPAPQPHHLGHEVEPEVGAQPVPAHKGPVDLALAAESARIAKAGDSAAIAASAGAASIVIPVPPPLTATEAAILHDHLLWLTDARGHAAAIGAELDPAEETLREHARRFEGAFGGLQRRALEIYSMLRYAPRMIPALRRLNARSAGEMEQFVDFLEELRELLSGCLVMSTARPLLADHMVRESLYYIARIRAAERV